MKKEVRICDVCDREMPKHQISAMKISYYRVAIQIYYYKDICSECIYKINRTLNGMHFDEEKRKDENSN